MEIALITPLGGMVLYVLTGMVQRLINEIIQGVLPSVGALAVCLLILLLFPALSLRLPRLME
jgi:C4-dicarboxylate transporter, DctM subunit